MTQSELVCVVRGLIGEVRRLRVENEKLGGALSKLKVEHQAVKDELARLKHLPPRPPQMPSGMEKTTSGKEASGDGDKNERSTRRRGSRLDKLTINETVVVKATAPAGSRYKGYEDIVVQDLSLNPKVTRYRRERWQTPDGQTIIAERDPGIVGGYGPHLHRLEQDGFSSNRHPALKSFVFRAMDGKPVPTFPHRALVSMLHFSGQMTCERIVTLLNAMGVVISKRQVVRLLTAKLETFQAEDEAVLKAMRPLSRSTTPARATRARRGTPRKSVRIASRCFVPARPNRGWRFWRGFAAAGRFS